MIVYLIGHLKDKLDYPTAYVDLLSLQLSKFYESMNHGDFQHVYVMLGDMGLNSQTNSFHYNKTISQIVTEWKRYLDMDSQELLKL